MTFSAFGQLADLDVGTVHPTDPHRVGRSIRAEVSDDHPSPARTDGRPDVLVLR